MSHPAIRLMLGLALLAVVFAAMRMNTIAVQSALLLVAVAAFARGRAAGLFKLAVPTLALVGAVAWLTGDSSVALLAVLRLFNILAASFLVFSSADPERFGQALRWAGAPRSASFVLTTALRYVPLMRERARRILEAQAARGVDLGPRLANIPNLTALFVPMVVRAFIMADDLAVALETRGYSANTRVEPHPGRLSWAARAVILAAWAAVLLFAGWERGILP